MQICKCHLCESIERYCLLVRERFTLIQMIVLTHCDSIRAELLTQAITCMVAAAVCQIDCNLHLRGPQLSEKKCVLICQCISINNQPSGYMAKTTEGCLYIVINDLYLYMSANTFTLYFCCVACNPLLIAFLHVLQEQRSTCFTFVFRIELEISKQWRIINSM
jgi:hypothetical protein